MVRRGMFSLPSPSSRKKQQNHFSKAGKGNHRRTPSASDNSPEWDNDSRPPGGVSEDSAPPAPPGDHSSVHSMGQPSAAKGEAPPPVPPAIAPRLNHGNHASGEASREIPKGSVQQNPFLAASKKGPLDENNRPVDPQALSATQERAKRLMAMEAQLQQQQQHKPPTPSTPSRKSKGFFGRSKNQTDFASPKSTITDGGNKGKKKGLLKSFFGGGKRAQKSRASPSNLSVNIQPTTPVGSVTASAPGSPSVREMKERFESGSQAGSQSVEGASRSSKVKPLITTQKSETDPDAFASSLLELATIEPLKHTPQQGNLPQQAVSASSHDGDDTTVSNLTNPTFQTMDPKAWGAATMDEMATKQRHSPATTRRPPPTSEAARPQSPVMGDFFCQKASMDSWEKEAGTAFSDPFFAAAAKGDGVVGADGFPPTSEEGAEDVKDAFAGDAFFVDEMKTDDFTVVHKTTAPKNESPKRTETTPVRPPRPLVSSPSPAAPALPILPPSPGGGSVASNASSGSRVGVRRNRSRLRRRSPSPAKTAPTLPIKSLPPADKDVVPEPPAVKRTVVPPQPTRATSPQTTENRRQKFANIRRSFSNRSLQSAASNNSKPANKEEPPKPKALSKQKDQEMDKKLAQVEAAPSDEGSQAKGVTKTSNPRTASSPARRASPVRSQPKPETPKQKKKPPALSLDQQEDKDLDEKLAQAKAALSPVSARRVKDETKATSNPRTTASPARGKRHGKLSQRYQSNKAEPSTQKKKPPALSLDTSSNNEDSTIYVVATSPTKKTERQMAFEKASSARSSPTNSIHSRSSSVTKSITDTKSAQDKMSSQEVPPTTKAPASISTSVVSEVLSNSSVTSDTKSYKPAGYAGRFSSRAKQRLDKRAGPPPGRALQPAPPTASAASHQPVAAAAPAMKRAHLHANQNTQPTPMPILPAKKKSQPKNNPQPPRMLSSADAVSVASSITGCTGRRTFEKSFRPKAVPATISHRTPRSSTTRRALDLQIDTVSSTPSWEPRPVDETSLTTGIFSVGKEKVPSRRLSELRVTLHRPRVHNRGRTPKKSGPIKTVFPCYDESQITDPMARAGLRLLSASVLPIQAATRRYLVGRKLLTHWWAALVIQTRFRGHVRRTLYTEYIAARRIQTSYRCHAKEKSYRVQKRAAIQIQSVARGMIAWQQLCLEDYCATEIQRIVRGHIASMKCYQEIYKITMVQAQWRKRQSQREALLQMTSLLILQAWVRGVRARKALSVQHASATEIQRRVRGHQATMLVYEAIYSVTIVQTFVRQKQAVAIATKRICALLRLQAMARGMLVRRHAAMLNSKAVTIQRHVRGHLAVLNVYEEIYKVMVVQNLVRRRRAINLATLRMTALIRIQSNWRTYQVRSWLREQNCAATNIQRMFRGYLATMDVYEDIYRITMVQNCWRRVKAKRLALQRKQHATQIEAIARGYLVRKDYTLKTENATLIQAMWRSFFFSMLYQFKLLDIIVLQSLWRRKSAISVVAKKRNDLHMRSATAIQTRWRCYSVRSSHMNHQLQVRSAIMIQSHWRGFFAVMEYFEYLASLITVQSVVRRRLAQRYVLTYREEYTLQLQRVARGFLGRSRASTRMYLVITVQSLVRTFLQRRLYLQQLREHHEKAAVAIQKTWRGFVCTADYMFTMADIVVAQTVVRQWFAVKKTKQLRKEREHQLQTKAATKIQSHWRSYDAAMAYLLYLSNVMIVQSVVRRWLGQKYVLAYKEKYTLKIQSAARGFLARAKACTRMYLVIALQSSARGFLQRRLYRQQLREHREQAATTIQRNWRGFVCVADFMMTIADIVIVQTLARRLFAVKHAQQLRKEREIDSAITIQRWFRSVMKLRNAAAASIQLHWHGHRQKVLYQAVLMKFRAARNIQSTWRMYREWSSYMVILDSVFSIQAVVRGFLDRCRSSHAIWGAILMQSTIRGFLARQRLLRRRVGLFHYEISRAFSTKQSQAAVVVQASFRRHSVRGKYARFIAARKIQALFRGHVALVAYKDESKRVKELNAACKIQAQWRIHKACNLLHGLRTQYKAAAKIQAAWKGFLAHTDYLFIICDVMRLQSVVRGFIARRRYIEMRERTYNASATTIQSAWRGYCSHTEYLLTLADLITIQTSVRRWLAEKDFRIAQQARSICACKIQQQWRLKRSKDLLTQHRSARCIQMAIRRWQATSELRRHFAARTIQNAWSTYVAKKELKRLVHRFVAASKIQSLWRGFIEYSNYLFFMCDIITVQSMARRWNAQRRFRVLKEAHVQKSATKIQAAWRCHIGYTSFCLERADVIVAQSCVRRFFAIQVMRTLKDGRDTRQKEAVRQIQSAWRMHQASANFKRYLAARTIQCMWRTEIANIEYTILHSARIIQTKWRSYQASSSFRKFLAARTIQCAWRPYKARGTLVFLIAEVVAATMIQATWRGYAAAGNYVLALVDIITIQSVARRFFARRKLQKLQAEKQEASAVVLQTAWRSYVHSTSFLVVKEDIIKIQCLVRCCFAKAQLRKLKVEKQEARNQQCAILLQKAWRGFSAYAKFCVLLCDVVTIQSCARRLIAQREASRLRLKRDAACATLIQKVWRGHNGLEQARQDLARILSVQLFVRRKIAMRELEQLRFKKQTSAAMVLQACWRAYFCTTNFGFIRSDVILAQCQVRRYLARKEFAKRLVSHQQRCSTSIQKVWRKCLARTHYLIVLTDIIIAQSQVRAFLAKNECMQRRGIKRSSAALKIQSRWRAFYCSTSYDIIVSGIITTQCQCRQYLARREFGLRWEQHQNECATTIQKVWRRFLFSTVYETVRSDIILAQSLVRRHFARKEFTRRLKARQNACAISIQAAWRGYLSHSEELDRLAYERRLAAAVSIQKRWRGYFVYATYAVIYSDIVKVQSLTRSLLARRILQAKKAAKRTQAATCIQKMLRGSSVRGLWYRQRSAAQTIQKYWRGHLGRIALFVAWKEHVDQVNGAATKIQSLWRGYQQQQVHLYTVGSAIQIQSVCRMALVVSRIRRQNRAATLIQANQRKFSTRMLTLNLLAEALYVKSRLNTLDFGQAALTIQCGWRYHNLEARLRYRKQAAEQRRNAAALLIASFLMMAKSKCAVGRMKLEKEQNYAATTLQLWYSVASRVQAKRRTRAGRKIYKFLKLVKAEVDKEIRAEKKRRKFREKMKNRTKEFDEALLEGAWEKVEVKLEEPRRRGCPRRSDSMNSVGSYDDRSQRSRRAANMDTSLRGSSKSSRRYDTMDRDSPEYPYDGYDPRRVEVSTGLPYGRPPTVLHPGAPHAMPPLAPVHVPVTVAPRGTNDYYVIGAPDYSSILSSPSSYSRFPAPRMKSFSRQQIDQDLSLEEAYLDVEIRGAKERRMADKLMKQQQRKSSRSGSCSRLVRPSSTSDMSVSVISSTKVGRSKRSSSSSRAVSGSSKPGSSIRSTRSSSAMRPENSIRGTRSSSHLRASSTSRSGSRTRSSSHSRSSGGKGGQKSSLQLAVSSSRSTHSGRNHSIPRDSSGSVASSRDRRSSRKEQAIIPRDSSSVVSSREGRDSPVPPLADKRKSRSHDEI